MSKKMIKSRYYKFPSLNERKEYSNDIPKYERLNFKQIKIVSSVLNREHSLNEINNLDNLFHWNNVLSNNLYKLSETHTFLLTHFKRGFNENLLDCNQRELVDNILFKYFTRANALKTKTILF